MTKAKGTFHGKKGGKPTEAGELETGVTGRNYGEKGSAFCKANPDKITVVVRKNSTTRDEAGNAYVITPDGLRQWGAWHMYLKRLGYNTKLMETRDYWTVPAPLPHLFDSEATVAADILAGDAYLESRRKQGNLEFDRSVELRRLTVLNALGYDPSKRRPGDRPPLLTGCPSGFRPYPRLWEAFANDAKMTKLLDSGLPFDVVTEASKRLAMHGKDESASYLKSFREYRPAKDETAPPPPPPPESSADLKTPAAPASDQLRKLMGLPPRPKTPPPMPGDDEFVEGFDIP